MHNLEKITLIDFQIDQEWFINRMSISPEATYYIAESQEFFNRLLSTPILEFHVDHFRDNRKLTITDFGLSFKISQREWNLFWASLENKRRSPENENLSYIFHNRPHEHISVTETQMMEQENSQEDLYLHTNPCDSLGNILLHKYRNNELFLKDVVIDRETHHEENLIVHNKIIKLLEEHEDRKKNPDFREVRCVAPGSS